MISFTLNWVFEHFLLREVFWVAFSSLITAAALGYTITSNIRARRKGLSNASNLLLLEMITNYNTLFGGEVDRPLLFEALSNLRRHYAGEIKDLKTFGRIQELYLKLEQYSKFVEKNYLTDTKIDRRFVTEQQVQACNEFLSFFGHRPVTYQINQLGHASSGTLYIEAIRNKQIRLSKRNRKAWRTELGREIHNLFSSR